LREIKEAGIKTQESGFVCTINSISALYLDYLCGSNGLISPQGTKENIRVKCEKYSSHTAFAKAKRSKTQRINPVNI